ncbi:MAG: hypothetical protein K2H64_10915 [Desulfovibrio sp.]|nr:hypothetical protein [Desulfovibrio sp.]
MAKKCVLNDLSKRFGNYANIDRALTDYYWFGRWRAHFGRTRFEVMFGPLPAYPCLNQYSLAALRMLSEEDIENGKFIYDFISRSSEILANVEYERPFPAAELNRTFIANPIQERLDTVREEYESSLANIVVKDGDSTPERVEAHSQDERTESSARYYSDYDMSQLKIYDFLNIMLAKAIVRISNFDQKLRSFCYKMYGIWNAEYDWHIKQSIVSKILDLDNCLMPLDTIKSAYFSEENLIDLINPVETFSYSDNKIELTLFPYINPADFIFGLRVFADGKHYDYRMRPEPVFEIAQPSPTAIGIRTRRNRPDAPRPKYMQRKIVK